MVTYFWREIREEAGDFFEDFAEVLFDKRNRTYSLREVAQGGVTRTVRPAVLFAERIDNFLKLVFGVSITVSACTATFVGFIKLSDLLEVLIFSIWGRVFMGIIGISYMLVAVWKLLGVKDVRPSISVSTVSKDA